MKKLLLFCWLASLPAFGQAYSSSVTQNSPGNYGRPVPFAQVQVCTVLDNAVPCVSKVSTYVDQTLAVLCSQTSGSGVLGGGPTGGSHCNNPGIADANGNFTLFLQPGQYTICTNASTWLCQKVSVGGSGVQSSPIVLANCTAAGTTLNEGVNLSTQVIAGVPTLCGTTAPANSTAVVGICASACGNSGSASVAYSGYQSCILDNQSTQNDYVVPSSNPGQCHDIGASTSSANETLGIAASTNTGAGTLATILLAPLSLILPGSTGGAGTVSSCGSGVGANAYYPGIGTVVSCDPLITDDGAGHGGMRSLALTDSTVSGNWFEVAGPALPAIASIPIHSFAFSVNPSFGTSYGLEPWDNAPVNGNCVSAVTGDATNYFKLHDTGAPCGSGAGSVTSVGLAAPTGFQISGSPVTTTGTLTLSMPTSWTTGDLLLGNGANSVARLPIGSNTFILTSNGTTAGWAAAAAGTTIQTNGTPNTSQSPLNFQPGPTVSGLNITPSNPSAGNEQMAISGALPTFSQVPQPASPTLTVNGTPGSTTISYAVVGCQDTACTQHTQASAVTTTSTANGTLTSVNSVTLSAYQMATNGTSVRCWNIYRTATNGTSPTTTGLIASCVDTTFLDSGLAGDTTTAPVTNTTVLQSSPQPLPGCPLAIGGLPGIDAPSCVTNALDDEATYTFQIAGTNSPKWSWLNQNGASVSLTNGLISLSSPSRAASDNLNCLLETAPATPYTFVAVIYPNISVGTSSNTGSNDMGVAFSDGTKLVTWSDVLTTSSTSTNVFRLVSSEWTNVTTRNGTFPAVSVAAVGSYPTYFKIQDDGTNLNFWSSPDGVVYEQAPSIARTFFAGGPSKVGFCIDANTNAGSLELDYWRRIQ